MIRFFYNLLFPLGLLIFLPGYLLKMRRRGNYRRNFGQRFGFYRAEVRMRLASQSPTWIHAVSVGEVAIALKLAAQLRTLDPEFRCVLTTTTTTGFAFAEKEAPAWIETMYNPLDFWPIVQRAFAVIRPVRIILVEAEVWPNLAAIARAKMIPLALVNARLSARSERRFRRFRALVAPTFRCLDLVCVQEQNEVERWAALGVSRAAIETVGSIKYDPIDPEPAADSPWPVLAAFGIEQGRPILFGGSTHGGEEEILAAVYRKLQTEFPDLLLVIAPRHVERTPEIIARISELGLRVARRSFTPSQPCEIDCLLLDTTGELRAWYGVATVVFVGKSLTAHGGQNPAEPILAGKPVIFGPNMENFATLVDSLVAREGAIQVRDAAELASRSAELLRNSNWRIELAKNGEQVLASHRGATKRTAELILKTQSHAAVSAARK